MGRAKLASSGVAASADLKDFIDELYRRSPATEALLPLGEEQYASFVEVFIPKSFPLGLLVEGAGCLERLAWAGDRVLGHVVSDYLLETMPGGDEKAREREYQDRVNNKVLHCFVAPRLGLKEFVAVDEWERNSRNKLGADLFEALVYKIEKNHGFEVVKSWVRQAALPIIEEYIAGKVAIPHETADADLTQVSKLLDSLSVAKSCGPPGTAVEKTICDYLGLDEVTFPAKTAGDNKLPDSLLLTKPCRTPGPAVGNRNFDFLKLDEGALAVIPTPAAVRNLPPGEPKGRFLGLVQRSGCPDPVWNYIRSGEDHNPLHQCFLTFLGYSVTSRPRTRKKEAEQEACLLMIERLQDASRV